jgi:hypothetical protein
MSNGRTRLEKKVAEREAKSAEDEKKAIKVQAAANLKAQKNPLGEGIGGGIGTVLGNILLPGIGGIAGKYIGKGLGGATEAALEGAEGSQIAKAGFGAAVPIIGEHIKKIGGTGKKPEASLRDHPEGSILGQDQEGWEEVDPTDIPEAEPAVAGLFGGLPSLEGLDPEAIASIIGGGLPG